MLANSTSIRLAPRCKVERRKTRFLRVSFERLAQEAGEMRKSESCLPRGETARRAAVTEPIETEADGKARRERKTRHRESAEDEKNWAIPPGKNGTNWATRRCVLGVKQGDLANWQKVFERLGRSSPPREKAGPLSEKIRSSRDSQEQSKETCPPTVQRRD